MSTDAVTADAQIAEQPAVTSLADRVWSQAEVWLETFSDYLNPILVKETRQALKSQQFVLWFLLLLGACWVVTIGGIAWIGPGVHYAASGGFMFQLYLIVLAFPLLVVVPFSAYRSLAAEQEDNTRDLLMVSALSPRELINGKLGSAVLQVLVYVSALAPCLAFSYLLRGIDLVTIVLLPTYLVLASIALSLLALLFASAAHQRYAQVITSVLLVAILLGAFGLSIPSTMSMVTYGVGMRQQGFWVAQAAFFNLYFCVCLLLYFASSALNAFASANRSTALRRVLLFTQCCYVGWVGALIRSAPANQNFLPEGIYWLSIWAGVFWFAAGSLLTGERAVLSERVRRSLPESPFGRAIGTWFNPGPGTGYLFAVSNLTTLLLLSVGSLAIYENLWMGGEAWVVCCFVIVGAAYIVGYLGIGRIAIGGIRRVATLTGLGCFLVHFLIVLAGIGLPELVRASSTRLSRLPFLWWDLPSPLRVLDAIGDEKLNDAEILTLLIVVPGIAACVFLVNLMMAAREIRQLRVPIPQRILEDDASLRAAAVVNLPTNPWGDLPKAPDSE